MLCFTLLMELWSFCKILTVYLIQNNKISKAKSVDRGEVSLWGQKAQGEVWEQDELFQPASQPLSTGRLLLQSPGPSCQVHQQCYLAWEAQQRSSRDALACLGTTPVKCPAAGPGACRALRSAGPGSGSSGRGRPGQAAPSRRSAAVAITAGGGGMWRRGRELSPAQRDPQPGSPLGPGLFSDGGKEVPPRYILRSLQELKREASASGNHQMADFIEVSCQDVTMAASKEKGKKKKVHQTLLPERKALQNWHHHMTIRKTQEKYLGEILQRPEDELVMNVSENYRQIQEERELIDLSLPALLPGKGCGKGSEFWNQPERIGDELTGLAMTLTRRERGYLEPITHVGKPPAVQLETGLKPPKKIPFHATWDKSLFLKQRRQEIKPVIEELDFYKPDLNGLEVVGKGQPFTSVSTEPSQHSTTSEESETLSDSLQDKPDVVPEAIQGPSLDFGGYPARWINYTTPCRDKIGITAAVMFETKMRELAENSLTVSNDGTTAIWYQWLRLPKGICTKETKGMRMPCFYFDTRSGVILPGQTKKFCVLFKSGRAGVFSEYWEFRTHPVLLGGASLQVLLCGLAEYVDEWADVREKLQRDLDARVAVSIAKESLRRCLDQIRTPERSPSPLDFCITEEELFHQKNPELHYQHQVVKQLHELWRKHVDIPSAFEVKVPSGQQRTAEDMEGQENISEAVSAQSSTTEVSVWKDILEEDLGLIINVEKEDQGPSGWNYSFEDFKQAILSIPDDEQREEALAQLNKAIEELRVKQRPTQSSLLYQTGLMLWSETIDNMVSCSMRLRSSLGLPENSAYLDDDVQKEAEETVEVKDTVLYQQYRENLYIQVYEMLQSTMDKMFCFCEELKEKGALKWETGAYSDGKEAYL